MTAFMMVPAMVMQFAADWHVENRVLWIVIGVLLVLLLVAAYIIVRTRMGNDDRTRGRGDGTG